MLVAIIAFAALCGAWLALVFNERIDVITVIPGQNQTGEVAVLRAQIEILERNSDQLITMVSTSLQVVVVIALGLAAFSWFSNNRLYERDVATVRREAQEAIATLEKSTTLEVQKQFDELKKQLGPVAATAAKAATEKLTEEVRNLGDSFWWTEHLRHEELGRAALEAKSGFRAFYAYLESFEALTRNRDAGIGGVLCAYSDSIEHLTTVMRELKYKPDGAELSRLERCLKIADMPRELQPAIDRLRKTIEANA
jgi:hypothetical protein